MITAVGSIALPNIQVLMSLVLEESTLMKRGENAISRGSIKNEFKIHCNPIDETRNNIPC